MSPACPFCHVDVPVAEIEWHANNHLEEEEFARDVNLAHQIALAPPSPPHVTMEANSVKDSSSMATECSVSGNRETTPYNNSISSIFNLQTRDSFHKVEDGLMMLLSRCLDMEPDDTKNMISGYIDHFQSVESEDSGWGCGWRNIQMLTSHLLIERQEVKDILFGGCGYVPDIPSLQKWLELAWKRGFDSPGAKSFNYKIYGSKKWIGATECATLFRSFGLRARIIDFDGLVESSISSQEQLHLDKKVKTKEKLFSGPMDKFVHNNARNGQSEHIKKRDGPQVLADWVWNYFSSGVSGGGSHRVNISEKMPLYFQHSGHSRTIVGIQIKKGARGVADSYNLLVLDPSQKTDALERSLLDRKGWQQLIKRGVHTLKKPQYQLCYVDAGIAHGEEIELLKVLDSVLIKI